MRKAQAKAKKTYLLRMTTNGFSKSPENMGLSFEKPLKVDSIGLSAAFVHNLLVFLPFPQDSIAGVPALVTHRGSHTTKKGLQFG